jgi:hypothetical protein
LQSNSTLHKVLNLKEEKKQQKSLASLDSTIPKAAYTPAIAMETSSVSEISANSVSNSFPTHGFPSTHKDPDPGAKIYCAVIPFFVIYAYCGVLVWAMALPFCDPWAKVDIREGLAVPGWYLNPDITRAVKIVPLAFEVLLVVALWPLVFVFMAVELFICHMRMLWPRRAWKGGVVAKR